MQQTKFLQPFHDVSLSDQHWNHDARFCLSFCPCLCLCFCPCDDVCASYAPCPCPYPCLCASYASSLCLSHFLIFLQLLVFLSPPIRENTRNNQDTSPQRTHHQTLLTKTKIAC